MELPVYPYTRRDMLYGLGVEKTQSKPYCFKCHLCVFMFAMKGMKFVLVIANYLSLTFCSECYGSIYMHCAGCFATCYVAVMGDGSRIVPNGLLRHTVALKCSEQPRLDPSRCIPPLLGLSVMRWEIS